MNFEWKKLSYASYYEFELKNSEGKLLLKTNTKNNSYILEKNIFLIADDGKYFWSVTAKIKSGTSVYSSKTTTGTFVIQLDDVKAANIDKSNLIVD